MTLDRVSMDILFASMVKSKTLLKYRLNSKKQFDLQVLPKKAKLENEIPGRMSPPLISSKLVKGKRKTVYCDPEASEAVKSTCAIDKRAKYSQQSLQATSTNVYEFDAESEFDTESKPVESEFVDPRLHWCKVPEILIEIFKHMTIKDLKNVRLTCKLWYETCLAKSITEKGKFVIRTGSTEANIKKVLSRIHYARINLEVHVSGRIFNLLGLHQNFLPSFGLRVQIIDLSQSSAGLSIPALAAIIVYCPNLTSLKIIRKWDNPDAENILDAIIEKGLTYPKLRTFETMACAAHRYLPGSAMNLRLLEKFLSVFPRLEDLSIKRYDNREGFDYIDEVKNMTFLNTLTQLKSLTYEVFSDDSWFQDPILSNWKLRLTKFETIVVLPDDLTLVMKFLSQQTELRILKLTVREPVVMEVKTMIFHILECCTKLEELHLSINCMVALSANECTQLFTMMHQLRVLTTISTFVFDELFSTCTPNLPLKVLSLPCRNRGLNCFSMYLLELCPTLEHLELEYASDYVLQTIFSKLLELRTLILIEANECTDYGFTGQPNYDIKTGSSIVQLRKLEYLDIQTLEGSFSMSRVIHQFVCFPRLKHLRLRVYLKPAVVRTLATLISIERMPNLESLTLGIPHVRRYAYSTDLIIDLVRPLKKLRFLFVAVIDDREKNLFTIRRIFKACPSLRFLQTAGWVDYLTDGCVYAYDPINESVSIQKCDTIDTVFRFPGYKCFNHERLW